MTRALDGAIAALSKSALGIGGTGGGTSVMRALRRSTTRMIRFHVNDPYGWAIFSGRQCLIWL
jgi:hypothetical protein